MQVLPETTTLDITRQHPPLSRGRRKWMERVLLVVLVLGFMLAGFVPAWRHLNSDFRNYYLVARLCREGYSMERLYEWIWFQRQWDHTAGDRGLVSYQPLTLFSALVVMPLSSLPPLPAKRCWLLLNLVFLLLTAVSLVRNTRLGWVRVLLLMMLAFFSLRSNFVYGQMHVFVLLLLTLAASLHFRKQYFWSGIALAIGAALKIYPAFFLIFLIVKKRWAAVAGLFVGVSASLFVSIYFFGVEACRVYVREVLPPALRSQIIDPYNVGWGSLNALLSRLFIGEPELNPSPVVHLPWLHALLYSLIVSLMVAVFLRAIGFAIEDRERERVEWASYLFLLLLVSSQPAPYHFVALILPIVLVTDYLLECSRTTTAAALVVLYVLVCGPYTPLQSATPSGWMNLLYFPRLFFLFLFAAILLRILFRWPQQKTALQTRSRAWIPAAIAFVTLFAGGFASEMRHYRGQFENYSSRLLTVKGSLMATDPVIVADRLFFTALAPRFLATARDTYAVHEIKNGAVTSFAAIGDWVHPAAATATPEVWAEVATVGGSQIVRFLPDQPLSSTDPITVEVEDAEQPVMSSDGKWLAYMREFKGRSSLWIRHLGSPDTLDREIAGPEFDAREAAFFPDYRLVFSSRRGGTFRLYVADPISGSTTQMHDPACPARYPAVSLDGQWIAFACERGGYWQLHSMNLATGKHFQLTNGDCNSVSPAWTLDSRSLIYATDCGRGLSMTALAKTAAFR